MIGTVVQNIETNKKLGCIVHYNPLAQTAIIFRATSPDHPTFGRVNLSNTNNMVESGNINDYKNSDLKQYLLSYLRTRNLSPTEEKVIMTIRNYAFPNGLPIYDSAASLDVNSEEHRSLDLDTAARPGRCLYLNTPAISPFQHLDNHKVYVISRDEHGLWVCTMDGSAPITSYLPFKIRPVADSEGAGLACHGVSRLMPLDEMPNSKVVEGYSNLGQDGLSQIIVNGTRVKIIPNDNNKVVVPSTADYKGRYYDYKIGDLVMNPVSLVGLAANASGSVSGYGNNSEVKAIDPGNVVGMYDNESNYNNTQSSSDIHDVSTGTNNSIVYTKGEDGEESDRDGELFKILDGMNGVDEMDGPGEMDRSVIVEYGNGGEINNVLVQGGGKRKGTENDSENGGDSGIDDVLDGELAEIMRTDSGFKNNIRKMDNNRVNNEDREGMDSEGMDSEGELEFMDDDEVEELGVYQKVRQMPVPEEDKVYKESIQRGRLLKQKLEKIPAVFRENPIWLNRVRKDVNTISMLKAMGTITDKTKITEIGERVALKVPDYKPLVEKMMNHDFTNQLLIPLVAARKRIYLSKGDTISATEFDPNNTEVIEDIYKHLENQELLVKESSNGGIVRRVVDIDSELSRIVSENVPELAHNNTVGLLFRLGEGIQPEIGTNKELGTAKLQMHRGRERQAIINQDTEVIRYGGGGAMGLTIQNYGIEQTVYDTFRALGPMSRYVKEDNTHLTIDEIEAMESQVDRNIEISAGRHKIYYNGDNLSLLGFVRPPLVRVIGNNKGKESANNNMDYLETLLRDSLKKRLNEAEEEGKVLIRKIGKRYVDKDDNDLDVMENPDKFIVYMVPMDDGKTVLNNDLLRKHLNNIIPEMDTYINILKDEYRPQTPNDVAALVSVIDKLEYFYPSNTEMVKILAASTKASLLKMGKIGLDMPPHASRCPTAITYDNYLPIKEIEKEVSEKMQELSDKLDRTIKLGKYRSYKEKERVSLSQSLQSNKSAQSEHISSSSGSSIKGNFITKRRGIVIPDELVEIGNKVYGEMDRYDLKLSVDMAVQEEITRLEYYAIQNDSGQYMNMLIHMDVLERLEKKYDKGSLELELDTLKKRYDEKLGDGATKDRLDSLKPELRNKLRACRIRIDRKPKIMKYPNVQRLEEDNGRVITNARGEVIQTGDYALIISREGDGKHAIYKREQLASGDFWISQPIEVLSDLMKTKKQTCMEGSTNTDGKTKDLTKDATKADMLELPEGGDMCIFDISKIDCMPEEMKDMDNGIELLETKIADVKGQLDMAVAIPIMLKEVKDSLKEVESQIRAKTSSMTEVRKYMALKNKEIADELILMRNKKKDCPHFRATEYLDSLKNIRHVERYHLVKKILEIYADQVQSMGLELEEIAGDPNDNYIRCHVCSQHLMCKHNLYAIKLIYKVEAETGNEDDIDDDKMADKYGYETGGSIYCRICGYFLSNTTVQDIEEFEKAAGKEGFHAKTREVIQQRDIIEQQKMAIGRIMLEALETETTGDMKFMLRIYKLLKDLAGLDMLAVEDELGMVNFIKTYGFVTKKTFYTRLYIMFMRLKKEPPAAALDKLASNQYWLHVTADIMAMFLVTLQTSRTTYQVYNSLCINNIIGWPLLRDAKESPGGKVGMDFMNCLAKQMVLVPGGDYAYLNPIEKFGSVLERRIEELINVDALVKDILERALDDKYKQITFMEEMESATVTKWSTYRPALTFWGGGVKWQPSSMTVPRPNDIIKDWQAGTILKVRETIKVNIGYQVQLLAVDLSRVVGESEPTTLFTRLSSIGNGCCPIDIEVEANKLDRYGNPEISYYTIPSRSIPEIGNHLRKMAEYQETLKAIKRVLYVTRYKMLSSIKNMGIEWYSVPIVDMGSVSQDIITKYFMSYVDSPAKRTEHGKAHLFDTFGRCVVSNQLAKDIMEINYTEDEFRRLYKAVSARKVIYKQPLYIDGINIRVMGGSNSILMIAGQDEDKHNIKGDEQDNNLYNTMIGGGLRYDASLLLSRYMNVLGKLINLTRVQEDNKKIQKKALLLECPHLDKIYIQVKNALQARIIAIMTVEPTFYASIDIITREMVTLEKIFSMILDMAEKMDIKWRIMWEILTKMCHILCSRFEEACIKWMKVAIFPKEMRMSDIQRKYFDVVSMLDTQVQNQIDGLVDKIGSNYKDEMDIEKILVDLGNLKDIKKDYENFLSKQLSIIPNLGGTYYNKDIVSSKRSGYNKAKFIAKMSYDLSVLGNKLANGAWKGLKMATEIKDRHNNNTEFFKYMMSDSLIKKVAPISRIIEVLTMDMVGAIFPLPQLIQVEMGIMQPELVAVMVHYALVWSLGQYYDIVIGDKSKSASSMISSSKMASKIGPISALNNTHTNTNTNTNANKNANVGEDSTQIDDDMLLNSGIDADMQSDSGDMGDDAFDLYPELVVEGRDGFRADMDSGEETGDEEDEENNEQSGGARGNFRDKLVETRNTNKNTVIGYIRDCIVYMGNNNKLANDMNETVIGEQIAKNQEQQIRRNLDTLKFLNDEGREDDYRMLKEFMVIGKLKFADLGDYVEANFTTEVEDDPYVDEDRLYMGEEDEREAKNYNRDIDPDNVDEVGAAEAEAKRDRYGFSMHDQEEMGYVGEAEEMEGGDFDYGYVGVD